MSVKLIAQRGKGDLMDLLMGDTGTGIGVVYETLTDRFFQGWWHNSILARGGWETPSEAAQRVYEGLEKKRVKDALKNTPITPEQAKRVKESQDRRRREQKSAGEDKRHVIPGSVPLREGDAWIFNAEDPLFNMPQTRRLIERLRKEGHNVKFVGDAVCEDDFLM